MFTWFLLWRKISLLATLTCSFARKCFVIRTRPQTGLCYSVAFQFSESVITFLATTRYISKPELFNWQSCLVSEETAVLTPYLVILITVTIISTSTWVGHSACALTTARWCSTPVRHLTSITWHPPGKSSPQEIWPRTLVLDKLLTVCGDSGETRQLRKTRSCVMNVTWVTTSRITSNNVRSAFTVVTDHRHANSIFVTHITVNSQRCQAFCAIWINDVISTYIAEVFPDHGTGTFIDETAFKAISTVTMITLAWIWSSFICTTGMLMTVICLSNAFI